MGLASSKISKQVPQKDLQEGSIPSTPILTPKVTKHEDLDPRSPSLHIARTPLQLLSAANLKSDEINEYQFNAVSGETPVKPNGILLGIDPRSPTAEFKRTPIIINAIEPNTAEKIRNKNLDRVRRSVIITTPKSTPKSQVSVSPIIPPKLLETSAVKVKSDAVKRKSFVGLLETNIDYTETDLDAVIREKNKTKESISNQPITPAHKQITALLQKDNIDPRSPTNDFLRTPIQVVKKIPDFDLSDVDLKRESICIAKELKQNEIVEELEDHKIVEKCVQEICESVHLNSESETSENQPLLCSDVPVNQTAEIPEETADKADKEIEESEDENAAVTEIPVQTKSAPITPPTVNTPARKDVKATKSAPVTPPINLTADVKEFDKKLTNLIYHDEDVVICPRKVKLKDYDSRSPLRNINSNEPEKKKSSQKLRLKENSKSEYAVSKIPVFKEKGKKTEVQCENTPPRNMERRKVKVRKSHWDNADATLII